MAAQRKSIWVYCCISRQYRFKVVQMFLSCTAFQPTKKARNYHTLYVKAFNQFEFQLNQKSILHLHFLDNHYIVIHREYFLCRISLLI